MTQPRFTFAILGSRGTLRGMQAINVHRGSADRYLMVVDRNRLTRIEGQRMTLVRPDGALAHVTGWVFRSRCGLLKPAKSLNLTACNPALNYFLPFSTPLYRPPSRFACFFLTPFIFVDVLGKVYLGVA